MPKGARKTERRMLWKQPPRINGEPVATTDGEGTPRRRTGVAVCTVLRLQRPESAELQAGWRAVIMTPTMRQLEDPGSYTYFWTYRILISERTEEDNDVVIGSCPPKNDP